MIYSYLSDRLGNNLFQIAAGYSHAIKNNTTYCAIIPRQTMPNGYTLKENIEKYKKNIFRKIALCEEGNFPPNNDRYYQDPKIFAPIPNLETLELHGFFQDYRYITARKEIIELFSIEENSLNQINSKYINLLTQNSISVHIRRKDYLKFNTRMELRKFSLKYYKKAIKLMTSKYPDAIFLVFSDDIDFCKQQFKGDNFYFISNSEDYIDLYLMSLCKHNIICNSSFSWWGAWLNLSPQKTVIAPQKWYGIAHKQQNGEIIPPEWIRIYNPQNFITCVTDWLYYPYYKIRKFILKIKLYIESKK